MQNSSLHLTRDPHSGQEKEIQDQCCIFPRQCKSYLPHLHWAKGEGDQGMTYIIHELSHNEANHQLIKVLLLDILCCFALTYSMGSS